MKKNYLKKMLSIAMTIAMTAAVFTGCGSTSDSKSQTITNKDPKSYSGSINVWSFTDELKTSKIIDQFNKEYPNIKINLTVIPMDNNAYSTKLASVLASGNGAPDVFTSEVAFVNRFVNTSYYENLSDKQYNGEEIAKDLAKYTVDLGRNQSDKTIRALSWQATPGGMYYKRSLAKQYLGTDDPDEISKAFSSWDKLIETGKEVNQKSGGKVKLLANYSEMYTVATGSRKHPWVENDKLVIDDTMMKYVDYAKQIRDAGIDAKFNSWSAPWSASMAGAVNGTQVLSYVLPTWGLQNTLAINAPKTSGDWGLAKAPSAYYAGGTWIGMYSKSQKKDLSWQFIKFLTTSKFQSWNSKEHGDFPSNLAIEKQLATTDDGKNAFAAGQNVASLYNQILPSISGKLVTKYDETINSKFQNDLDLYITGQKSKSDFIAQFKQDVKSAFPDVNVN